MPFIHVRVARARLGSEQIHRLQHGVTAMMAGVLRKKAELTSVLVKEAPVADWSIGGKPIAVAAHLDAKITAGTNTTAEKARFIADANALLKTVVGAALPVATYVVIDEVPGDAWGYDGLTQAHRATANQSTL